MALPLRLSGIGNTAALAQSRQLLAMVGLADRFDHLPDELSGGEQQRVALARAVALRPAVLLADEPTGNLDSGSARHVLALLQEASRQSGTTVLMMTQDPTAASFCERILHMRDGQLVAGGG